MHQWRRIDRQHAQGWQPGKLRLQGGINVHGLCEVDVVLPTTGRRCGNNVGACGRQLGVLSQKAAALMAPQLGIHPIELQQLRVSAGFDDAALVHD